MAKIRAWTSRLLTLIHILLLVLLVFLGVHTWQNVHKALLAPTAVVTSFPPAASAAAESKAATRPLADYRIILERNLFNVAKEEAALPKKQFDIEKIAPAAKNLGLKLVGTVMADDPWLRRAFIENSRTRKQEAYREGDTTGEFRIKKIMRDKVVIATASGDQLLAVGFDETGKRTVTFQDPQQTSGSTTFPQAAAGEADVGVIESRLIRSQVESGLSEKDYLMKQVQIYPYAEGEQPAGFRISNIRAGNILLQMGLRSGDVIIGVDGEAVTGPDEADAFFKKLAQGGEITVQIMRRGRPVQIQTNIE
ncbi:MAG: hypothetical protein JSW39_17610 [Desulfobacterales bacterium]|nr:MAG: hypothetical protein JSW39_17610 [Desulfobacterales bacterium]